MINFAIKGYHIGVEPDNKTLRVTAAKNGKVYKFFAHDSDLYNQLSNRRKTKAARLVVLDYLLFYLDNCPIWTTR